MGHVEISRSKEPIRLFKSDLLEFFTHVHPAVVAAIWLPMVALFLIRAVGQVPRGGAFWHIPAGVVLGLFVWTLAEYLLHRFLFHFTPHTPRQERLSFLIHGVHHAQPMVKTRLVMPPAVSIPLATLFYGLYWLVLAVALGAPQWVAPLFAGFVAGYLAYDMTHYSLHHAKMRGAYAKALRTHHMRHHSQKPVSRFGVSSTLWDHVFGTLPKGQA
ncbi:MAG: sterol desaturase family protein [Anaerolineae bacterium]